MIEDWPSRPARGVPDREHIEMLPPVPPVEVSRLLLLALIAVAAVVSITTTPPLSSFAGGFAAGAGAVIVLSFLKNPRGGRASGEEEESR
jgi:hypothetical protein